MVKIQLKNSWSKPTDKSMDRAQSKMGVAIPLSYAQFLKRSNGGEPIPGRFDIGGVQQTVSMFFGVGGPQEQDISNCHKRHWNYVAARFSSEEREKYQGLLTIAEDELGNPLFIGTKGEMDGKIYYLDKKKRANSLVELAKSLDEFLSSFQASEGDGFDDEEDSGAGEEGAEDEEADDDAGKAAARHGHSLRGKRRSRRYNEDDEDDEDGDGEADEE